jgi:hypothetical protein
VKRHVLVSSAQHFACNTGFDLHRPRERDASACYRRHQEYTLTPAAPYSNKLMKLSGGRRWSYCRYQQFRRSTGRQHFVTCSETQKLKVQVWVFFSVKILIFLEYGIWFGGPLSLALAHRGWWRRQKRRAIGASTHPLFSSACAVLVTVPK